MKSPGSLEVPGILQRKLERKIFALKINKAKGRRFPSTGSLSGNLPGSISTIEINLPGIPMENGSLLFSSFSRMT